MNRAIILFAASGATAALITFASPASAQERESFAGPRAEVTAGYDTTSLADRQAGAPESVSQARIGVALGYDLAVGNAVTIGAEIGAGGTLGDGRQFGTGSTRFAVDQGRDLDASLRLGLKAGPRTLVYGKAGWANSKFIARSGNLRQSSDENGLRLGAGVEHMLTDHVYAKAEYRYTSYGQNVDRHQVLGGVGFRF